MMDGWIEGHLLEGGVWDGVYNLVVVPTVLLMIDGWEKEGREEGKKGRRTSRSLD